MARSWPFGRLIDEANLMICPREGWGAGHMKEKQDPEDVFGRVNGLGRRETSGLISVLWFDCIPWPEAREALAPPLFSRPPRSMFAAQGLKENFLKCNCECKDFAF